MRALILVAAAMMSIGYFLGSWSPGSHAGTDDCVSAVLEPDGPDGSAGGE